MNRHTLRVLEFEKIRHRVRDRCLTAEAAHRLRRARIPTDRAAVTSIQDRVELVKRSLGTTTESPVLSFPPLERTLERLAKDGTVLEPSELADIAVFAQSTARFCEYLERSAGAAGTSQEMAAFLGERPDVTAVPERLFRYVDPDGTVREREIPELQAIRQQILRAQQDLQRTAAAMANRDDLRRYLSSTVPTQRDGRTVLPLKADHRGKVQGIIHETSGSGATVFIEPEELLARNNAVVESENRYRAELLRILRELTGFCRGYHPQLSETLEYVVGLDEVYCRARFSHDFSCERASSTENAVLLRSARHPLLGEGAVPITVEIPAGKRVLIVTGPNTGGKTVSLKTVGLLALMNQFGLQIPADPGSELPILGGVYADIGDEQSIEQNLSTFSGHMRNIARILNHADDRSLVLLDELGSGTDPEEGGALAMAILDELLERGPFTVVTTHHGRLKHYGFTHEQALNASVEFDQKSLRPTYHIIPGVPGSSHAVEIASQMGILRTVTGRARNYLAGEEYDTGRIIRRLTDREQELHREGAALSGREQELERERENLRRQQEEVGRREAEVRRGTLRELDQWAAETRSRLENLVREIREGELTREKTQAVKGFIAEMDEDLARFREDETRRGSQAPGRADDRSGASPMTPGGGGTDGGGTDGGGTGSAASGRSGQSASGTGGSGSGGGERETATFAPGTTVRITSSGKEGVIQRRGKGSSWVVQVGPVRLPVDESELRPVRPGRNESRASVSYARSGGRPTLEMDVRGYRLEEALDEVERQIDQALVSGMSEFGIIHGMGEGILQKGIRDLLRRHPSVAGFDFARPEEGGFGKTIVHLG